MGRRPSWLGYLLRERRRKRKRKKKERIIGNIGGRVGRGIRVSRGGRRRLGIGDRGLHLYGTFFSRADIVLQLYLQTDPASFDVCGTGSSPVLVRPSCSEMAFWSARIADALLPPPIGGRTVFMSLSIGMTIAPKLEIYNQLLCRAIGPERSGTTTPAPGSAFFLPLPRSSPENPVAASNVKWFVRPKEEDMRREVGEYVMGVVEKGTEAFEFEGAFDDGATKEGEGEEESWSKQCHKSREVQKAVASLVRFSLSLFPRTCC